MKQNLNGLNAFLKTGSIVISIVSLLIYTFLRSIFWGVPFDISEEISIPVKAVVCGNVVFIVFVFSFLLLERTLLYLGTVAVPNLKLSFTQQHEPGTVKKIHGHVANIFSSKHAIVYDEVVVEEC